MRKQLIGWAFAAVLPQMSLACTANNAAQTVPVQQFLPYAELSTLHWPSELEIVMGGVLSFLVPKGSAIEIKALSKGMSEPLREVNQAAIAGARMQFAGREKIVKFDRNKYQWMYVHASSFGKSQLVLQNKKGWRHTMTVGVVYPPSEEAGGRPPVVVRMGESSEPVLQVNSRDTIVLSVPGEATDHWRLMEEAETGFKLTRIEHQEVPYGDAPRVRIFLSGSASLHSAAARIQRTDGAGTASSFGFKLEARPVPAC